MLDQTKYEYIEVDMPNIFITWSIDRDKSNVTFGIDKDIKEFVTQAAIKFPMWKFVSSHNRREETNGERKVDGYRFEVYEDREKIGELNTDYSRAHGRVYCISNERIRRERERGSYSKTKDLAKAIKIVGKQFGAKTILERLREADGDCETALSIVSRTKSMGFNERYRNLTNNLIDHIMSNWDSIKEIAAANKVSAEVLDLLPTAYEDYTIAEEVQRCYEQKIGAVVTIHGKDYAVSEKDGVTIYGTDDLPEWLKRGVGMLKLVEKHNIIGKVGFKINDQSFFVMRKPEDE